MGVGIVTPKHRVRNFLGEADDPHLGIEVPNQEAEKVINELMSERRIYIR